MKEEMKVGKEGEKETLRPQQVEEKEEEREKKSLGKERKEEG